MITTLLLAAAVPCLAQPRTLEDAEGAARERIRLETLRRAVVEVAADLESWAPGALDASEAAALQGRLRERRGDKSFPSELAPVLDRLDAFYADVPRRAWAAE